MFPQLCFLVFYSFFILEAFLKYRVIPECPLIYEKSTKIWSLAVCKCRKDLLTVALTGEWPNTGEFLSLHSWVLIFLDCLEFPGRKPSISCLEALRELSGGVRLGMPSIVLTFLGLLVCKLVLWPTVVPGAFWSSNPAFIISKEIISFSVVVIE